MCQVDQDEADAYAHLLNTVLGDDIVGLYRKRQHNTSHPRNFLQAPTKKKVTNGYMLFNWQMKNMRHSPCHTSCSNYR